MECRGHALGELARGSLIAAADDDAGQTLERRVVVGLPVRELALYEAGVVVSGGQGDRGMRRREGLHDDAAAAIAAAGAACDLRQQLEGALGGAEVRNVQA